MIVLKDESDTAEAESDGRPRLTIVVAVWALISTGRIFSFSFAQAVLADEYSPAWLFPALGDAFIGITAPFVAFAIWRRKGLGVWVTAIVWFTFSITDRLVAITAALSAPFPVGAPGLPSQSGGLAFWLTMIALDVIILVLLTRRKMKSHYLGSFRSAE